MAEVLAAEPEGSAAGVLCDPPYGIGTAAWDDEVPGRAAWEAVKRILEPGAWALVFGHPRTEHRLKAAMEEASLELCDTLLWVFATGAVSARTRLKPAWQPVVVARRPGPARELNIDGCRTGGVVLPRDRRASPRGRRTPWGKEGAVRGGDRHDSRGRWPKNVMLDHGPGCSEVRCLDGCPVALLGGVEGIARFFYCAKPAGREARDNPHPTKKPVHLTTELARLIGGAGGRLLVPWCGSGSELVGGLRAGWVEGIGIDRDARWLAVAERRLREAGRTR